MEMETDRGKERKIWGRNHDSNWTHQSRWKERKKRNEKKRWRGNTPCKLNRLLSFACVLLFVVLFRLISTHLTGGWDERILMIRIWCQITIQHANYVGRCLNLDTMCVDCVLRIPFKIGGDVWHVLEMPTCRLQLVIIGSLEDFSGRLPCVSSAATHVKYERHYEFYPKTTNFFLLFTLR